MLKDRRQEARVAEIDYQKAKEAGNEDGMKAADHRRALADSAIATLGEFKSGLARFSRTYAYIAQLIELNDPELENFATFAKLLGKRLNGIPPEEVDLKGLTLTGFAIKAREGDDGQDPEGGENSELILKPVGAGGSPMPGSKPIYLLELIKRLNTLFGDAAPLADQAHFVNQIASIAQESGVVMAQVGQSDKELAMKGNLPGAVQGAVVRAMSSNNALAKLLLQGDRQAMGILTNIIYDILKTGDKIDLNGISDD